MPDLITATNHTSFTVADLDRAIALFRDGLGFALTSRAGRDPRSIQTITGVAGAEVEIAYLRRPDHTVELIAYSAPRIEDASILGPVMSDLLISHSTFKISTQS